MMARSNAWASEVDWHTGRWQMRSGTPRPRGWHPPPPRGLLPKRPLTFVEALDSGFRLLRFIPGLSIGSSLIVFTLWSLLLTAIGTAVWDTVLIGIGAAAGSSWQLAAAKVDYQSALLLMAAFSVAVVVLPLWLLKRKRAKREKERRQKC